MRKRTPVSAIILTIIMCILLVGTWVSSFVLTNIYNNSVVYACDEAKLNNEAANLVESADNLVEDSKAAETKETDPEDAKIEEAEIINEEVKRETPVEETSNSETETENITKNEITEPTVNDKNVETAVEETVEVTATTEIAENKSESEVCIEPESAEPIEPVGKKVNQTLLLDHKPDVKSIEINTDNVKKDYYIGDKIILDGLTIKATCINDVVIDVDIDDCKVSKADMSKEGSKIVTISYESGSANIDPATAEFEINVTYQVKPVDNRKMYVTSDLNLRKGPGTNYEKLTSVGLNTEVTVVGEVVDSVWVKIVYKDKEYFCSSKYLSKNKIVIEKSPNNNTGGKNNNSGSSDPYAYGSFIKGEKGTDAKVVQTANKYWNNNVPKWLRNKFKNSGWKIVVSKTPLNRRFGYKSSIAGMTRFEEKTIYLDNRISVMKRAMIHELGHFVDCVSGWPSQSSEFKGIYKAEKGKFKDPFDVGDGHAKSNEYEYFAEVFNDIIMLGKNSLGNVPKTYDFVSNYIG